jgi:hypothetical protein
MFRSPVNKKHLIMTLKSPLNFFRRKRNNINEESGVPRQSNLFSFLRKRKTSNTIELYDTDSTNSTSLSIPGSFPMEQVGSPMSLDFVLSFFTTPGQEWPFAAYNLAFHRLTLYCPFGLQGRGVCGSSFANGPYSAEYEWEMLQHIKDAHGVDVCGLEDGEWLCKAKNCGKCGYQTRIPTLMQRHRREQQWV